MNKNLNIEELQKLIDSKHVNVQKHAEADYYIYNYSPKVQFERFWNDITLQCRGLILDANYNIIARPFNKFFNLEEHDPNEIPNTSFEVYEKMDGSLGIIYWLNDKPYIATRGSFESDQSKKANEILNYKYSHVFDKLDRDKTYLLEIIYPENRIVCQYGDIEDLFLLAIIDNKTGLDLPLENVGFPIVKRYDGINDLNLLKKLEEDNKEGFVVKFNTGFRVKVKFEEYCRLHRILTNVSNKTVWEYLSESKPFDELLERVPDEFYNSLQETKNGLICNYNEIEDYCKNNFKNFDNRAEAAACFKNLKYTPVLFKMLDQKDYSSIIWKFIKPNFEKPFSKNEKNGMDI